MSATSRPALLPTAIRHSLAVLLFAVGLPAAAAEPADVVVYRVINGYNGEVFGEERLRIERRDAERTVYEVTRRRDQASVNSLAIDSAGGNG